VKKKDKMKPKKIILILIDTLRADHLGCYGYKRNTSPNIDTFAKEGLIFKWPFAPISYTVPSITSLFTGKYPSNHCTMFSNGAPVKSIETDPFLTDILGSEGYETAAFVSSLVIGKVRKVAITSGFKTYNDEMTAHELNRLTELIRSGDRTNEAVFKWLEKNYNTNFFSFIHYFDLHGPYVNPKPYDELFVNDDYYGEPEFINKIVPEDKAIGGIPEYQLLSPKRDEDKNLIDFEKDINYYIAQYDGGIRYCDEQIGNLFNKLRELGIYDDCLIILTSDHGEALGENNVYFYHGLTVTMDQIHVPLILKPHTNWHPNTNLISAPVSLVDLMPTILDLIGYDFSELDIDGVSILDIEKNSNRKIISEIEPQIAHINKSFIHLKPRDNLDEKKYFPYIKELCSEEKRFNYRKDTNREPMVLEWTGERYLPFVDPEISGAEIHYEHLHRYAFAAQFVKGKKVLDFASGEGYGSYMLSKEAELVIGVEIDEKTVKHASSSYIRDNLEFIQGSILKVPIEGEKMFDAIICFEAIEHVEEHEELMKEVKRLLRDDGIFIVSSPNKKVYTDDPDYHNPFHPKELYFDEFKKLLNNYFTNTNFFGQRIYTASNLWRLTSEEVHNYSEFVVKKGDGKFYFSDSNEKVPLYFIAVASNADLNERYNMGSSLVDASNILIEDYKRQIEEVNVVVQRRDEDILNLEAQIGDISSQLKEKDKLITELNVTVLGRDEQILNLEEQITDISGQLTEKEQQLNLLNVAVQGNEEQIKVLEGQITAFSGQLKEKDKQIDVLNVAVQGKEEQIRTLDGQITNISGQLRDLGGRVRDREMENLKIHSEINSIKSSVTWRTVMKWHSAIEQLMPQETRRRRGYDLSLVGLRTITNEGWSSFWWKYKQHRASKRVVQSSLKSTKMESPNLDLLSEDLAIEEDIINKKVSIVIPTKNAGPDFDFTLEKIGNQKGINDTELIIVDSGSIDGTVKLAEKYGAKVYSIKPDEFNHGETRNYGAEKATGDYILFMVQDAIPIGDYWLYNMVKVLESDSQIAAATCRQVPRSDADLFACFSIWNHHKALDFYEDRIAELTGDFDKLPPIEKRKLCGLDDMCNLVRKDVFDKFKFEEIQYAEDIDLGLKLIKGGHKLAFLYSVGVVHSHKRDAFYILCRYYVDNKILQRIFNYREYYPECTLDVLLYSILVLYSALNSSVVSIKDSLQSAPNGSGYFNAIIKLEGLIRENLKVSNITFNGDQSLNEFFHKIDEIAREKRTNEKIMNYLISHYQSQLNDLKVFIQVYRPTEDELIATLYDLFSIVVASALAIKLPRYNDGRIYMIESLLEGGV
jgi:arylsulfatase A-like enzyme/glycosyltransferase involved in cell wall biosynthesis/2-polyprenyl-3-methyl-5-hydroxy-6-metoxy-1,4-benzoquinol methylase/peptidoglycan hydrolase CwlO-like protein